MKRRTGLAMITTMALCGGLVVACGDDSSSGNDNSDPDASVKPDVYVGDCNDDPTPVFAGEHHSVVSSLKIASGNLGFDLDYDGLIDNALSPLGALANSAIGESFDEGDIIIPFEFYGLDDVVNDECLNFSIYFGMWPPDQDFDGESSGALVRDGEEDCNDYDPAILPDATELPGDRVDNNCDGLADETFDASGNVVDPTDTTDNDGDGYSPADGDCDDRALADWADAPDWWDPAAINPGQDEVCGDGLDNNCSGIADELCDPYSTDDGADERIMIDENSLVADGSGASIVFQSARIEDGHLFAGPSMFSFAIDAGSEPVDLRITHAMFEADVVEDGFGVSLTNGILGGVLSGYNLDRAPNIASDIFGAEDNTLLDAFVGPGGILLGLPTVGVCRERGGTEPPMEPITRCEEHFDCGDTETYRCDIEIRAADLDMDNDGLELWLDLNLDDDDSVFRVDTCVDGDGSIYYDDIDADGTVLIQCTEELDGDGNLRFVDGYSIAIEITTTPTNLFGLIPRQ
jgi:Putative metal-binding motif